MKTKNEILTENENLIVSFHIGRGGRFHNAGHLSYLGERKIGSFISDLFESDGVFTDCGGREVGLTQDDVDSGVGAIRIDFDYDTTYTKKVADLEENEINCILEIGRGYFGEFAESLTTSVD